MTDREPYLALRNFKVWFSRHRGFVEALRRSDPGYVRAVDGINITIGKGEIYCLVGESGCGKTTTGKGILQLVPPTGGDVFLNPRPAELARFDASKPGADGAFAEEFRKHSSLTYEERSRRRFQEWLLLSLLILGGGALGVLASFALLLFIRAIGAGGADFLSYFIVGIPVAFAGTLPLVKMNRRLQQVLTLATIPACAVAQMLGQWATLVTAGSPSDIGSVLVAYGNYMQANSLFTGLAEIGVAAIVAWFMTALLAEIWAHQQGIETDPLRKLRTRLQIIFQDPYESLNPRHTVYSIVAEPLIVNRITRGRAETEARVEQALNDAGLRPPKDYLLRYPHELSGGQRQRVGIAGALVLEPEFLVADEPVSMLDVSIRTEIVELLLQLRQKRSLTYLVITHDLSLAYVIADRIGVMYLGKIVEEGPTAELVSNPRHPYTKALISVVPIPDPEIRHQRMILRGERPDPSNLPPGCRFHPRCPVAFERCGWSSDELLDALRVLATGEDAKFLDGAAMEGPGALVWTSPPDGLEPWLRGLIASKAEEQRALKAVQSIDRGAGGLKVTLHAFEEPTLKTVGPGLLVSCHLY